MKTTFVRLSFLTIAIGLIASALPMQAHAESNSAKREKILHMRNETLSKLYKIHPAARGEVHSAVGYAVFSNIGVNLILLSAGGGSGVAHDNRTGKNIYMKMVSGGIGLGLGVKDFRGVFIFRTHKAFNQFVNSGWEASAQADAAAKSGKKGGAFAGAITVAPDVYLYQITENGLALQATIQGTKYYKDKDLNAK